MSLRINFISRESKRLLDLYFSDIYSYLDENGKLKVDVAIEYFKTLISAGRSSSLKEKKIHTINKNREDYFGGRALAMTKGRVLNKLIFKCLNQIMSIEFTQRCKSYKDMIDVEPKILKEFSNFLDDFLLFVPGIRIIQEVKEDHGDRCYHFALDNPPWCEDQKLIKIQTAVPFLETKGYHLCTSAQKNDVIAYYDNRGEILHWGKVTSVDKEGVVVTSKFGESHIYEHREEIILSGYGKRKVYFRLKSPSDVALIPRSYNPSRIIPIFIILFLLDLVIRQFFISSK